MISDEYRCIFIHAPKCAGESIETVFLGRPFNITEYEGHPEKHWGVHEISTVYPEKFSTYFSFSVVRNPWERVISWVRYRDMRWGRTQGTISTRLHDDLHDARFVQYMLKHSFVNLLVLDGRIAVDRIIRMENLQLEFPEVCKSLGMGDVVLPHSNRTTSGNYSEHYNDNTRERVATLFEPDIRLFGYEFQVTD